MSAESVYLHVSALLRDYLKPLGMLVEAGPLRVLRELTAGIVFTGSVQLTNAARLFVADANQLAKAVERMSLHLCDEHWDHRDWAGEVLKQQADAAEEDELIPIDGTELAKPYARRMQYIGMRQIKMGGDFSLRSIPRRDGIHNHGPKPSASSRRCTRTLATETGGE